MKLDEIRRTVGERLGIDALNPMQQRMVEHAAEAFTILLSPTGTGKTMAFALPLLMRLRKPTGEVQAVVIAPSRELVMQIAETLRKVAVGAKVTALYGGHAMKEEKQSLAVVPDVIVATPGRLLDHLQRGHVRLEGVKVLVIDEWDKTLQLGFADEMRKICQRISPAPGKVILTSATAVTEVPSYLPAAGRATVEDFRGGASLVADGGAPVEVIEIESAIADKLPVLKDLLMAYPNEAAIVFVNHRESVKRIVEGLNEDGIPSVGYHGALDQLERTQAVELFANGTRPVLVTTDLASRGLDIPDVKRVIHYHLPPSEDAWTHRNGRTARMGASGEVYVIVSDHDDRPEYVKADRSYMPPAADRNRWRREKESLHFNLGKKDKISRGDIVGFLIAKGGLESSQIGRIALGDHWAIAAVDAAVSKDVVAKVRGERIKNKRVLVSVVKNA